MNLLIPKMANISFSATVFLAKLHDILKLTWESCQGHVEDTTAKFYDDISFNILGTPCLNHLLNHIANVKPGDEDVISIQYQFVTVSLMIWSFGLDDIKVLSLKPIKKFALSTPPFQ